MTFRDDEQRPTVVHTRPDDALATRRHFLKQSGVAVAAGLGGGAAAAVLPGTAVAASPRRRNGHEPTSPQSLQQVAEDAVIFGSPVVLMQRYFLAGLQAGMPINQFFVNTELSSPATLAVGPNDDTLYGLVWLDLTRGPQVIGVPDTHGRYYSIQLIDFWTNPFAYIGYRTTGTEAGAFAITPPGYRGRLPRGVKEVPATTKRLLGLVRTLVNDPADLPAAQAIQTSYTTGSLDRHPFGRVSAVAAPNSGAFNIFVPIDLTGDGIDLYEEINQGILEYPPLPADARYARTLRPVGVDVERYRQPDASLASILKAAITPAWQAAQAYLPGAATVEGTWSVVLGITDITHDPLRRLGLTIYGPGTHIEKEALYYSALPVGGTPLSGANTYQLRFAKGQLPPVEAFWSLIMYGANNELVANPINRYELASHNPTDLNYASDGSLTITISNAQPASGTDNWLPAPDGPFRMILRTYVPETPILNGTWQPPDLQLV
ncbi:MAG: DUF1254 domain-containing protein [Solirubrobacteraceae bacterium]